MIGVEITTQSAIRAFFHMNLTKNSFGLVWEVKRTKSVTFRYKIPAGLKTIYGIRAAIKNKFMSLIPSWNLPSTYSNNKRVGNLN